MSFTMAADSTDKLSILNREIIQNKGEAKSHYVKMIRSTKERKQAPLCSRPSVICKVSNSGSGSNIISRASSSCTALHQESKHGRVSEALPLNSQEKDLSLTPASKKKYEDKTGRFTLDRKGTTSQACVGKPHQVEEKSTPYTLKYYDKNAYLYLHRNVGESHQIEDKSTVSKQEDQYTTGHISLCRKRTISQARFDEPHPFEDENTAYKQEDRDVHCPWYYRKRTIIQIGEPHPDDNTVIKQAGNKDVTAYPARPCGKKSKRQTFLAKPWPRQREDESTLFKREDRDKNAIGHLPWMHGEVNFKLGKPCEILGKSAALTREDGNHDQARLGEPHQKDDSGVFKQASENTLGHVQWFKRKETIKQASIGQTPPASHREDGNKYKDERIWYLKWLYGNRTIKQGHLGTPQQREVERTKLKEENEETTANRLPWSYGNRTIKQGHLGEPQQREVERTTLNEDDEETTANRLPWSYGNRTIKQGHLGEPQQREVERTTFKEEDEETTANRLPWSYGNRNIKQGHLGKPQQREVERTTLNEDDEETTANRLPWSYGNRNIKQGHLGEPQQREVERTTLNEDDEETTVNRLPWSYGNRTIKQGHLGEPQQREVERTTLNENDEETTANRLPWLYGNRTIKQGHLGEPQQRGVERTTHKEDDEETATHFPWLNGKRTMKQVNIGDSQQKVKSNLFRETNSENSLRIKQLPNDQLKNPSEYNETGSLGCVFDPRKSRKKDVSSLSKDFHPMKQDVLGWSNVAKGITGTTCPICYKKMSRSYHLKGHLLIHTGEKPHKCAYCSKSFNQIGNRNAHQRIHTGEKPYACEYCGKRFIFSSSKQNHMKIHFTKSQRQ